MSPRFVSRRPAWLVPVAMAAALLVPALTVAAQSRAEPPREGTPPPPNWERQWNGVYGRQDPAGRIAPPGFTVVNPRADMDDLVIPLLNPWAYARYEATELDVEDPGLVCRPTGLQAAHAQRGFTLVASPGRLTLIGDGVDTAAIRRIYLNRGHLKNPPLTYWGDSVAHWEGDTLVIDTIGFTDKTLLTLGGARHSTDMHVVERWRFVANGEYLAGISILPAPDGPFIHPRSAEPTRLCLSHHRPGSEAVTQPALTCRGLEARASKGFLRHRSSLVSSPCQAGVLARAARQPAGTGSAQIRWSIAPNRRRVR